MEQKYNHLEIEAKWQEDWKSKDLYKFDLNDSSNKEYILVEFPYPSGNLHVGHWYAFACTDIYARYRKMIGNNVFFPIGFDAFGLPAENAAIKRNLNPRTWTYENMETMKVQFKLMGTMFDWSKELATCDPEYYKWTQWLFLQLYNNDLAYQADTPVNWCPSCKTVLANEQVVNGECERCGTVVDQRNMKQWLVKITKYADKLADDLQDLNWPEEIKQSQRNWIGKSHGCEFICKIKDLDIEVKMYNSVPQTFMAETFTAIATEHPLINKLVEGTEYEKDVMEFIAKIKEGKAKDKFAFEKDNSGIFTGRYIENFCGTGKDLPIWIAPYVINDYGTGIVNASAHDQRDFDFAKANNIPLHPVMFPNDPTEANKVRNLEYAYCRDPEGVIEEPEQFKGRKWSEARDDIINHLIEKGYAIRKTNYKLRDWIVSRQRYWGCPIPIIHCKSCGPVAVPEKDLPVILPDIDNYLPRDDGKSPLAKADSWMNVKCPKCGEDSERETDTLDTFVDSSWYFSRYLDPKNSEEFSNKNILEKWLPVNFYSGGAEHTTMHLLYARFFTKALYDLNLLPVNEPFLQRLNRGLIMGPDGQKMSKSKGNVIDPDIEVKKVGADTVRLYLAFIGPYNEVGYYPWDPNGIVGVRRFLERVWDKASHINQDTDVELLKELHKTIKKVNEDSNRLKFNTAIAQMMVFVNKINNNISRSDFETFLKLLAPFAPHITEELWYLLGNTSSIHKELFPVCDPDLLKEDSIKIAVQVNGKARGTVSVAEDFTEEMVKKMVLDDPQFSKWIGENEIKRFVYVKGKIANIVI